MSMHMSVKEYMKDLNGLKLELPIYEMSLDKN